MKKCEQDLKKNWNFKGKMSERGNLEVFAACIGHDVLIFYFQEVLESVGTIRDAK